MPGATALRAGANWLLRPAVGASSRESAAALASLRILVGLLWLYNVSWKVPPDFGEASGNGVYGFLQDAVANPVLPPFSWLVENVLLPNFTPFAWAVLVVESLLAVMLLTGTLVRVAAFIGIGQSLAIGLSVAFTPGEWPWAYWMMIGIHVVLLLTASGAAVAVDRVRAEAAQGRGQTAALGLLRLWGAVVSGVALVALFLVIGTEPLASRGPSLGGPDLSISLGSYNLLGALGLLLMAGLMLAAAVSQRRELALLAAVLGLVGALSVYAQVASGNVWLGGTNTSAAFLLCAAMVSVVVVRWIDKPMGAVQTGRFGRAGQSHA